jgi:hypothetical protein
MPLGTSMSEDRVVLGRRDVRRWCTATGEGESRRVWITLTSEKGDKAVGKVKSGDRCADCKHCKVWGSDHTKATCALHGDQGFHPDRTVLAKCVGKVERKY